MAEKIFPAAVDQLGLVQAFIEEQLEGCACSPKARFQLAVAVEEIFVNIAHYAYPPEAPGVAAVRCSVGGEPLQAVIRFRDSGKPFDPLAQQDADTTLSAEVRSVGGLGILLVKKSMDGVEYEYREGSNILTIRKNLN